MNLKYTITLIILVMIVATPSTVIAQSEKDQIRNIIDRLFDGMRAGDSTIVRSVMHKDALMARVNTEGLSIQSTDRFIKAVGMPHDKVWDERIWNLQISVDGDLASAWMDFAFFLGDEMSHCGVNSMQLYRTNQGWKIIYIADTNRPPNASHQTLILNHKPLC